MRALFLPLLTSLVQGQWGLPYNACGGCPPMPGFMGFHNFFPMAPMAPMAPIPPFPPMPPMMPIVPQHVGNGMGGYVTSGKTANGVNFASAGSYSSSNGGGPPITRTWYSSSNNNNGPSYPSPPTGPRPSYPSPPPRTSYPSPSRPYPAPPPRLPYRPNPSNTVHQESEKRVKLPNGGELITKTMVEKTANGQRVSSFSYSHNPLGPVMPNGRPNTPNGGKLPFSTKERLEQYNPPLEGDSEQPEGDVYIREGSGEGPTSAFAYQSASSSPNQPQSSFAYQSASSDNPGGTASQSASASSSNAIFD